MTSAPIDTSPNLTLTSATSTDTNGRPAPREQVARLRAMLQVKLERPDAAMDQYRRAVWQEISEIEAELKAAELR